MEKKYLDQLLPDTKKLLLLIEKHVGKEIAVREDPTRNILGCDIDNFTILTPIGQFWDSSVMHELLHFHRFKVKGVPRLVACDTFNFVDPDFETNIITLDNIIEHLFIVREEIKLRPNRKTYWEDRISHNIERQKECGDAILNWVFARHVFRDGSIVEKATKAIQKFNCEKTAKKLLSILHEPNCKKELFIRAFYEELNLQSEYICLKYLDREEKLWINS